MIKKLKRKKNVQIVKVGFCLEFELAPSESDLSLSYRSFSLSRNKKINWKRV